jgi:hypothetical protein
VAQLACSHGKIDPLFLFYGSRGAMDSEIFISGGAAWQDLRLKGDGWLAGVIQLIADLVYLYLVSLYRIVPYNFFRHLYSIYHGKPYSRYSIKEDPQSFRI